VFEKIEESMHLPRGSTATAELVSADDVSTTKPGLFGNVPAGCYWLVETQEHAPAGTRKGIYLYNAQNGRSLGGTSTLIKIDKM
jgi:hypothetical protein